MNENAQRHVFVRTRSFANAERDDFRPVRSSSRFSFAPSKLVRTMGGFKKRKIDVIPPFDPAGGVSLNYLFGSR